VDAAARAKLGLRALDLLDVAYVNLLKGEVDAFVTGDEELLEASERIGEVARVRVCSVRAFR
jgi:hypothetical protein